MRQKRLILPIVFACFIYGSLFSQNETSKADSIINRALKYRDLYGRYIQSYEAEVYIKGNSRIKKKNFLFRFAPDFLYWDRTGEDSFTETFAVIRFNTPNHFTREIKAITGNRLNGRDIQDRVMQFLDVNIYNPTLFNDRVMLPGIGDIYKYYRFEYVSSSDTLGRLIHKIQIIPLIKSQKLISGYIRITDKSGTVFSFDVRGRWEFTDFRIETEFGMPDSDFLLPQKIRIMLKTKLLGNEVVNDYFTSFKYTSVTKQSGETAKTVNYDLSNHYSVRIDTLPIVRDSVFWNEKRPAPLSDYEKSFYEPATSSDSSSFFRKSRDFYLGIATPRQFTYNNTQFNYSGFLNPLKLAYSKTNGITYWQQFRLSKKYPSGKELRFNPNIGFLFNRKEVYFSAPVEWLFQPRKFGNINFTFGNRSQAYNSTIIDEIKSMIRDSINFKILDNLKYYRHFYFDLNAGYEPINGLLIYGGIDFDWYIPVKSKKSPALRSGEDSEVEEQIDLVSDKYKAFVPEILITWTPGQYYRINGKKKEYAGSRFPTFSFDYGRGIRGVMGSNSDYERIEIDAQQRITLGLMHSFRYYIGAGRFTNTRSVYFADFKNFQNHHFPQSWKDPIGGVFQLLNGEWYNASDAYVQAHFMYESPFTFLKLLRGVTEDLFTERLYLSQLYTPVFPCYTEIGFGVGNFILDAGVFVSFDRGKYSSFGAKITFELGR